MSCELKLRSRLRAFLDKTSPDFCHLPPGHILFTTLMLSRPVAPFHDRDCAHAASHPRGTYDSCYKQQGKGLSFCMWCLESWPTESTVFMPYFLGANSFWVLESTLVSEHLDRSLFADSSQPGCQFRHSRENLMFWSWTYLFHPQNQ